MGQGCIGLSAGLGPEPINNKQMHIIKQISSEFWQYASVVDKKLNAPYDFPRVDIE